MLEQAYGGALLAELLLGGPVMGLGNDVTPLRIGFQQGAYSPVDDLMVEGEGPGGQRTLFIGVRRKPKIGASQNPFVKLVVDYLRAISDHGAELEAGSWRLGLAVEAPHTPTDEIKALAYFASRQPDASRFRAAVHAPRATTRKVRDRLSNVDDVVASAVRKAAEDGIDVAGATAVDSLSWRLLRYMHVLDLQLEGDDAAGRTSLVARLVPLAGDAAAADDLRRRLSELSAGYALGSAVVDEEMLRRDLSGTNPVGPSPAFRESWQSLETLEDSLNSRTHRTLAAQGAVTAEGRGLFAVDRAGIRASLLQAMSSAGEHAGQLVVHGEPDAGKSALVLTAVEEIRRAGAAVLALSLRDIPPGPGLTASQVLHAAPRAVFAATAAAPVRLVVLDGAEAAQENGIEQLRELARAAAQAGLGLVAVTRDDARATVTETLASACQGASGLAAQEPGEMEVPPLTGDEVLQVRQAFTQLNRLASDERSAWLLRRVGIIDVLLRGDAVASLPDGSLSEADVLGAVWSAWVRNNEQPSPGGATADGREEAMLGLARRRLTRSGGAWTPVSSDPRALASLRSDGLLLPAGPRFAFRPGDDFAGDTLRDFALAVLFAREGFDVLRQAEAPRWALRAARMACQGKLIDSPPGGPGTAGRMSALQAEFNETADAFGDRWADLPWEAALTAGSADAVLRECARDLLGEDGAMLNRVLRLIKQRFSDDGAADPVIAAPVVAFLSEHAEEVRTRDRQLADDADEVTVSWLRSVSRAARAGGAIGQWQPLRAQIRDRLLTSGRRDTEADLESLALLGSETDNRVTSRLRQLAAGQPHRLAPCIEPFDAVMSLAETDLDLLFDLTEAYYIEETGGRQALSGYNMGIRRHQPKGHIGVPFANWLFGPFWRLLRADPHRALALINRILDHAANWRVASSRGSHAIPASMGGSPLVVRELPGVRLDVASVGARNYVGDGHVWAWYRGTSVGPYPCMSALLAVEEVADDWLRQGMSLARVIAALLHDAHNLAMPGLVVGLLARYAEQVAEEADPFLQSPAVWGLESGRAVMEAGVHAAGHAGPQAPGSERRSWTMINLAGFLVFNAMARGDQNRIDALRAAGYALLTAGQSDLGEADHGGQAPGGSERASDPGHELGPLPVRRWASMLDAANYTARQHDGTVVWEWQPPADLEATEAATMNDLEGSGELYRLLNSYSLRQSPPYMTELPPLPQPSALAADAQSARSLAEHPPTRGPDPIDAVTAVAATLLRATVQSADSISRDDLKWAVLGIVATLLHPGLAPASTAYYPFPRAADRSAASAAYCLLMPALTEPGDESALVADEDLSELPQVLSAATASPFLEVRLITARTLRPVWSAPCGPGPDGSERCRHTIAWAAVEAGTRDVTQALSGTGPDHQGDRQHEEFVISMLADWPADELLLDRLAPPVIAACDAAASSSCVAATAQTARDNLLNAYTRTAVHWAEEGYDQRDEDQYAVAEALLNAFASQPAHLGTLIANLAGQAGALSEALHAMTVSATYSARARGALKKAWPHIMTAVLDATEAGAPAFTDFSQGEHALAEMVPSPSPVGWDSNVDATINAALEGWPAPGELTGQIARLLPHAAGYWHVADNLIGLLKSMSLSDQGRIGLPWLHEVIASRSRQPGWPAFLAVSWLRSLSEAHVLDDETRPLYNSIVDALAAEAFPGAVELQRQGE